jgi:hypothetical protein
VLESDRYSEHSINNAVTLLMDCRVPKWNNSMVELRYDYRVTRKHYGSIQLKLFAFFCFLSILFFVLIQLSLTITSAGTQIITDSPITLFLPACLLIVSVLFAVFDLSGTGFIADRQRQFIQDGVLCGTIERPSLWYGGTTIGESYTIYACYNINQVEYTKRFVWVFGNVLIRKIKNGYEEPVWTNKIKIPWTFEGAEQIKALVINERQYLGVQQ